VIQEESAALAALILDPKPGEFVVDLCAAPGGKTEHMGELMRNKGVIHAFDVDSARIRRMRELLRKTGVRIVRIHRADGRTAPKKLGRGVADKVLVDPPCTSDGTLPKNPDLRWRMYEAEVPKLAQLQYELLVAASKLVRPGGRILYTTCSLLPEEDEEVVRRFLERNTDFRLIPLSGPYDQSSMLSGTMRAWPHRHGTIGFFYALIERVGPWTGHGSQ
jgi:16S rRNA (cytosine967-C5)-methyltransferase